MRRSSARKPAQAGAPVDLTEQDSLVLSAIEDEWLASRLRGETATSERLLHEAYKGTTSDGLPQTKADFLRALESTGPRLMQSEHRERDIRIYGDTACSTGVAALTSSNREHSFRYLRVYRKSAGEWRLVAAQATRCSSSS